MLLGIGETMDPAEAPGEPGRIGGVPWLPSGFEPPCSILTGQPMAFLFQIAFPSEHPLGRHTMAVFLAIDGVDEDLVVPPLSCGELSRVAVTPDKLAEQQALHGAYLFDRDHVRPHYDLLSPVEARRLIVCRDAQDCSPFGQLGDDPDWLLDDETPGALNDRHPSVFCLSTAENLVLPRRAEAPLQIELDFFSPNGRRSRTEGYEMFAGNAVYYFAYPEVDHRVVLVVQGG